MGAPTTFTQELADEICERIACGETLREICALPHMPSDKKTIYRWRHKNKQFRQDVLDAMDVRFEMTGDKLEEIDEDTLHMVQSAEVTRISAIVQAQKMRSDNVKWVGARMARAVLGDHVKAELTGKNEGPVEFVVKSILDKE